MTAANVTRAGKARRFKIDGKDDKPFSIIFWASGIGDKGRGTRENNQQPTINNQQSTTNNQQPNNNQQTIDS